MKAPVNKIIPFSSVDGPGNRTAVFLQGCNLDCKYCHNPETRALCVGCGLCVAKCPAGALKFAEQEPGGLDGAQAAAAVAGRAEAAQAVAAAAGRAEAAQAAAAGRAEAAQAVAAAAGSAEPAQARKPDEPGNAEPASAGAAALGNGASARKPRRVLYDPAKCLQCDTCIHICPHNSSPRTVLMTPEEAYRKVKKQIPFIRGITVSGGECMLWPDFLLELFRLAKKDGLGTLIDSNGMVPFSEHPKLLAVTDGVMLDIKAFDPEEHRKVTGAGNEQVLENAVFLAEQGKLYEVRFVIVPDLYDTEKSVRGAAEFLAPYLSTHEFRIKVIAYRPMGVREEYSHYRVPGQDYLKYLADICRDCGFQNVIII